MKKLRTISTSQVYFGLMIAMAVSLPLSKGLMSIVTGMLMLNWIIEGQFTVKIQRLKERKSILLIISVFLFYLLGLLWTNSMKWGMHDLKIQLPLFILPLVIGTSIELNYPQVKRIIYFFSAAVVLASFCSVWVLLGFSGKIIQNPREMSLFISHIRFALLINISIFSMGWYLLNPEKKSLVEKAMLILAMAWLSIFLVILKSATGWVVYMIVFSVIVFIGILRIHKPIVRIGLIVVLISIFLAPTFYIAILLKQFYTIETISPNIKLELTKKGNLYSHDFKNKEIENGHYTYLYMNETELRETWNRRSAINFDSTSVRGYNRDVLMRYLTSKGYRKDAEGIENLTDNDILNIENGMTNYRFANSFAFYKRIYQIAWEFNNYRNGGNPSGHSVTQRIEYYKMAFQIIKEHFWLGNGTGGYYMAYQDKYDQNKFFTNQDYRQRSHNMLLSYWIDFGLIGLIYICFALVSPVFLEKKSGSFLLLVFLLIVFISFMNEDTLNNHDAITFFSFFFPLYLYSNTTCPYSTKS